MQAAIRITLVSFTKRFLKAHCCQICASTSFPLKTNYTVTPQVQIQAQTCPISKMNVYLHCNPNYCRVVFRRTKLF